MINYKILVVEDDADIANLICRALREDGYETFTAANGVIGLALFENIRPHLVITDLILPEMDGRELCRSIRNQNSTIPIIMLTALNSTEDVIQGLDAGADDYLSKPFRIAELLARIRAVLRRTQQTDPQNISRLADLTVNHETKEAFRSQDLINLTATEFRLLEYLILHQGKIKTRVEILEEVWGIHVDPRTNVVDVYINYLRNKMDKPYEQKLLHTKVGLGFILKS